MDTRELENQALKLPHDDREELALRLLASLETSDQVEIERLWAEEAERRYAAHRRGECASRPADEVFRDARRRLG